MSILKIFYIFEKNKEHLEMEKRCTIYANNGNKVHLLEGWGVRIKELPFMLRKLSLLNRV
jgi:hypothetical protein